jgi:hypothetical protein
MMGEAALTVGTVQLAEVGYPASCSASRGNDAVKETAVGALLPS